MTVDLQELERLLAEATTPPWGAVKIGDEFFVYSHTDVVATIAKWTPAQDRDDAKLICLLRNAAPDLLRQLREAQAEQQATRTKLQAAQGLVEAIRSHQAELIHVPFIMEIWEATDRCREVGL